MMILGNKRAVSLMISYVLLIVIAISVSIGVFAWMKSIANVEQVIDPTGAGDTFAGALMGYLTKVGKLNAASLKQATIYATTLASFNVEGFGMTKTAHLTLPQVYQRMKKLMRCITPPI